MAELEKIRLTAEDFIALDADNTIRELINGEVIMTAGASASHQDAVLAVAMYLKRNETHGKTQIAPLDVYLDDAHVLQPDVFWVANDNDQCVLVDDKYWRGAPDLVVEVLSFSTANRDYRVKYDLYEKFGVKSYWLVDSVSKQVKVFHRAKQDSPFALLGDYTQDDRFEITMLYQPIRINTLLDYP